MQGVQDTVTGREGRDPNALDFFLRGWRGVDAMRDRNAEQELQPLRRRVLERQLQPRTIMTPEQSTAMGFRPGTVVQDGPDGPDVLQNPAGSASDGWVEQIYTPETLEPLAYAVAMGAPVATITGGRNSRVSGMVNQRAAQIRQDMQLDPRTFALVQSSYAGNRRSMTELISRRNLIAQAEQGALDGFRRAMVLHRRIPISDIPMINRAWIEGQRNITGSPEAVEFYATLREASEEYAKVLSGATGAAGVTEGASERARDLFSEGFTYEQMEAAVNSARNLMAYRMNGFDHVISGVGDAMVGGQALSPEEEIEDFNSNPEGTSEASPEYGGPDMREGPPLRWNPSTMRPEQVGEEDDELTLEDLIAERERRRRLSGRQ